MSTPEHSLLRAMTHRRLLAALGFLAWAALVLAAFYVVQRPFGPQVARGLAESGWAVALTLLLAGNAAGLGDWLLGRLRVPAEPGLERLCLATGTGLGALGLAGLGLAWLGWTERSFFLAGQLLLLPMTFRRAVALRAALGQFSAKALGALARRPLWGLVLGLPLAYAFLLALTPPSDGFDALFYHLPWPAWVLRAGGLRPFDIPHFWFPHLVEGVFLWARALGSDRTPQLLHVVWGVLAAALVFQWGQRAWDNPTGRFALLVLVSMPSLPLLASWAYTDLALVFYSVGTLYALWRWHTGGEAAGWLLLSGMMAGMAMGVKYTSFVVPVTAGLLVVWWQRRRWGQVVRVGLLFSAVALLVAAPWYARNWVFMGNPFYPFAFGLFGGRFWDAFRAAWYADAGTGIGWSTKELLLLPLNVTLGHRDANYYDGRIGPLYLLFLPVTLWAAWREWHGEPARRSTLLALGLFVALGVGFWTLGVVRTAALWQARLLLPALFPLALLTARGLQATADLDTPHLQVSFIVRAILAGVLFLTLFDVGRLVVARNPLAVILGLETPQAYRARVLPEYTAAMRLLEETPPDARVYFLFEPRSYGAPREVQPDPILDNLAHGVHRYGDVAGLAQALRQQGYTHVLLYRWGANFLIEQRPDRMTPRLVAELERLTGELLELVGTTPQGHYELYRLPEAEP